MCFGCAEGASSFVVPSAPPSEFPSALYSAICIFGSLFCSFRAFSPFFLPCPCTFAPSVFSSAPAPALLLLQTSRRFDGNNDLFSELLYGFFLGERGRVQYWKSPTICECSVPPAVPRRLLFSYSYIWPLVEQTSSISFADIR